MDHLLSDDMHAAVQALLAIAFLLLAYQLILLKSEHFHISRSHPSWFLLRRYQLFTQLLSIPLIAALIVIIVYAALLKNGNNVSDLWRTFDILLFIWWGAFVLWMILTPFWARENKAITGMFILLLVS